MTGYQQHEGQHAVGRCIVAIAFDGAIERADCSFPLRLGHSPEKGIGAHHHFPRAEVLRRSALQANAFGFEQFWLNRGDDFFGNFVLKCENVG